MAFSQGAIGMSDLPSCFESMLGVIVESVQGSQLYLECIGTPGTLGIVARSLEFLSNFKLRPPPLSGVQNARITFPTKQGNGPSSRDEEVNRGSS